MNPQKPREIAYGILRRHAGEPGFVDEVLHQELDASRLPPRDRGLVHELVCGVVRWQATLDWLIERRTGGRRQMGGVQSLLRLGLYQLFWLDRVPDHAAVNETVALARQYGFSRQAGFVNALLRGYGREREATRALLDDLKTSEPAVGWSHPAWLVDRWQRRWGADQAACLLEWNNTPAPTFARLNTLKTDAGKLLARWREEDVEYDFGRWDWLPENLVFLLKAHPPFARLGSFRDGWFYVQDPSTLLAVQTLDPAPGQTVLDLCAAPGGKTTFIAQRQGNEGHIVAEDVSAPRLSVLAANCARLGATIIRLARGDAPSDPASATPAPLEFDRILVDAPCSNTGVMRRRIDLRWRLQAEEISRLQAAQLALLDQAVTRLKPGGRLVYSTCSLEPEENREVTRAFLDRHSGFGLESERELVPFLDRVDGAYVAAFQQKG